MQNTKGYSKSSPLRTLSQETKQAYSTASKSRKGLTREKKKNCFKLQTQTLKSVK